MCCRYLRAYNSSAAISVSGFGIMTGHSAYIGVDCSTVQYSFLVTATSTQHGVFSWNAATTGVVLPSNTPCALCYCPYIGGCGTLPQAARHKWNTAALSGQSTTTPTDTPMAYDTG